MARTFALCLFLFLFTGIGKMQKSVPILHPDSNKFSKMPDTKTKTKKIILHPDNHFITTEKKYRAAANIRFALCGLTFKFENLYLRFMFVMADNFVFQNPAHRKPEKR
ncbi:MAG: hypothetical protein HY841_01140 [Bacteroidetes bacterium]|nr:hypothetical protein [Bacteroidota bacterium]